MSLETASFIKGLVPTNPEGTDPKSQGDDHLRLLKAVLQSQFSGFTDGKAVTLTESQLNALGGVLGTATASNIDTVVPYTALIGIVTGMTGTLPPGGAAKDMLWNLCFSATSLIQVYYASTTKVIWMRVYDATAWSAWIGQSSMGVGQTWQVLTGSRAFAVIYTNNTGRPITVNVVATSNLAAFLTVVIDGGTRAQSQAQMTAGQNISVSFVVPPGSTYQTNVNQGLGTMVLWTELR